MRAPVAVGESEKCQKKKNTSDPEDKKTYFKRDVRKERNKMKQLSKIIFIASLVVLFMAICSCLLLINSNDHTEGAGYVFLILLFIGVISLILSIGSGSYLSPLPGGWVIFKISIFIIFLLILFVYISINPELTIPVFIFLIILVACLLYVHLKILWNRLKKQRKSYAKKINKGFRECIMKSKNQMKKE